MKKILGFILLTLIGTGIVGWFANIVSLVHLVVIHAPVDTVFIARLVGIPLAALGAIMGFI